MAKLHYEITLLASWVFKLSFKPSSRVVFGTLDSIFLVYFIGTTYVVKG